MRHIDGIPEGIILFHYAGRYSPSFGTEKIITYSPTRGANTEICVLRWRYTDNKRISLNYSRKGTCIIATHKLRWINEKTGRTRSGWVEDDQLLVPVADPDGVEKVAEFIRKFINKLPHSYLRSGK